MVMSAPRPTTYVVRPPWGSETLGAARRLFLVRTSTVARRWLAAWLVLTLLFTQAATAAYSCPMLKQGGAAVAAVMTDCADMGGMTIDAAQPNLCKAHCDAGKQSLNPALDLDFSHGVVLLGRMDWSYSPVTSSEPVALRIGARSGAPPGAQPGLPALYLALQVLRI